MKTLPNDVARCNGISSTDDDGVVYWRAGCETCLRRTATRPEVVTMISPPPIITYWCEYLIEPKS